MLLDWSQAELARQAGMNPATVSQIEAGRLVPYPSQLNKLACALGITENPEALLRDVDEQ
jgi:transcriptional regulator with XRE-family HTH domain